MDKSRSHDGLAMQGDANRAKSTNLRPWLVRKRAAPAAVLLSGLCMLFLFGGYASYAGFEGGTAALEVLLALAALVALRSARPRKLHVGLATSIIAYFIVCGLYAVRWNSTNVLDYIQASKFLWYVLVVLVFSLQRKPIFDAGDVVRFSRFVLLIFFGTYSVKRLALGQDRPVVLVENNFELIFVILLFYGSFLFSGRIRATDVILLCGTVILSGSRSSAIVMVAVLAFCIPFRRLSLRTVVAGMAFLLGAVLSIAIFKARSEGAIDTVDRYNFFQVFLYATRDWSVLDFLVGSPRLTPLPPESCVLLSFYESLFSYSGDGRCYSVILHSFNLRVIYDHGLMVFAVCLYAVWIALRQLHIKARVCVTLVILLTGMSVSALNNVYVAMALTILSSGALHRSRIQFS